MISTCLHTKEYQTFARALSKINHMSRVELKNKDLITTMVREVGLVKDRRPLYGFNGKPGSEEKYMHNISSLGMFQLPKQVGCMLTRLTRLNISTFIEIGAFYGWTGLFFTVFLQSLHHSKQIVSPWRVD